MRSSQSTHASPQCLSACRYFAIVLAGFGRADERHLPGWYGDRHPNLAGYNAIADETAKYLAKLLREEKAKE